MSNKIKTAKELKEKYGIGKIKKQAQKVYDENYHLLENFMKKNNLDKYWYELSQSVFFICIGNDGRVEIEKNIKNIHRILIIGKNNIRKHKDVIKSENINYSKEDTQINGSIPRRLVAQCCIDSLKNKESINKLIEVTSSNDNKKISFKKAMQMI